MFKRPLLQSRIHCSVLPYTLILMGFLGLTLSGCQWEWPWDRVTREPVQEPPLIPDDYEVFQPPVSQPQTHIETYADLLELADPRLHHPKLKEAVSQAIRFGVLKPTSLQERFEPQNPIRYGDFRNWTIAYQSAATIGGMVPESKPDTSDVSSNPMSLETFTTPPSQMQWGPYQLTESQLITRETLCALYVFLSQQESKAQTLTVEQMEAMLPQPPTSGTDEPLSQFKDYPSLSPWAKPYVALAYRDGLMDKVFRLAPTQLNVDEGFSPTQPITRAEALLLLHTLYAEKAAKQAGKQPTTKPIPVSPATDPVLQTPSNLADPLPMGHWQQVQESTPHGSRTATRMSAPD